MPNNGIPFSYHCQPITPPQSPIDTQTIYESPSLRRTQVDRAQVSLEPIEPCSIRATIGRRSLRSRPRRTQSSNRLLPESYRRATLSAKQQTVFRSVRPHAEQLQLASRAADGPLIESLTRKYAFHAIEATSDQDRKNQKGRVAVVQEMLATEQKYVRGLAIIQTAFIEPLVESLRSPSPILDGSSISSIFSNLIDIININSALLTALEECLQTGTGEGPNWTYMTFCIGNIFASLGPFFKVYKIYCQNFTTSIAALELERQRNRRFREYVDHPKRKFLLTKLSLSSHLLSPIQRIPRYQLMLAQMLRWTPPDSMDYVDLKKGLAVIELVALGINEAIRRHENWQTLHRIDRSILNIDSPLINDPSRKLIMRGTISKVSRRSHQVREMFLFSDCLIYATPAVSGNYFEGYLDYYIFNRRIPLNQIKVESLSNPQNTVGPARHYLRITSHSKSFLAYCASEQTRTDWVDAIELAKLENLVSMSSFRTKQIVASSTAKLLHSKARRSSIIPALDAITTTLGWTTDMQYPILRNHPAPIVCCDVTVHAIVADYI